MATFEQIARAAQGFGAGFQGRGAQFQQGLAREREQEQKQQVGARKRFINELGGAHSLIKRGNIIDAITLLSQSDDPNSRQIAAELQDPNQFEQTMAELNSTVNIATSLGELKGLEAEKKSGEQKAFEALIKDFSPEDKIKARRTKAGLDARAIGSAAQTIAAGGTAEDVAASEAIITQAKESGKQRAQLKFKPQIARAVTLATKEATARGETLTDLKRAEAALPGLQNAIGQLKELAPIATSTLGGRVFDTIVKEAGFSTTKGANARVKFVAIINNQVLPLLRETFGAAFTAQEGETLKATMGDPDSSPTQKLLQLDAFIDQKMRDIQAKQSEVGAQPQQAGQPTSGSVTFLGFE